MRTILTAFHSLVLAGTALGQTYTIKPFAGGGWPEKVPALSVGLASQVYGVAVDRTGNLYFSIVGLVLRLDGAGNLTRVAGDGVCRYDGDNGPAASAGLCHPGGLAVDAAGNLYIADSGSNVVRKVSNGIITTVAGSGSKGYKGDNGSAASAQLSEPWGLAMDTAGSLYIADTGNGVVRKVLNGIITTVAGRGSVFGGDGGPATSVGLNRPQVIAVDSDRSLYILDRSGTVIRKVSNGIITTFAGSYSGGADRDNISATSAALSASGLAVDSSGNVYVSEETRGRIRKISGGVINTIAGTGVRGHSGDGGPATAAQLDPRAIAIGANGDICFGDGQSTIGTWIRCISNGIITTVAGNGVNATGVGHIDIFGADDNGFAANAFFANPTGIAVDTSGRVYVVDAVFSVIREISNGTIRTIAGNWSRLDPIVEGIPATQASLGTPLDVAVDARGDVFVTERDQSRVRRISNGIITTMAGGGTAPGDDVAATSVKLSSPIRLAVDSSGNAYFTDGSTVRKVADGIITTIAGNGIEGYGGDNGPAVGAQLNFPAGVAVDTNGDIYFAESNNSRIRKISNGIITTIAGNGTQGYGGDNGPAVDAQLNHPDGVAVDTNGDIYVADTFNSRIRKISNGIITTIAGNGTAGYGGDDSAAESAQLNHPEDLAVDAAGNIYVADTRNHRVRVLVPSVLPALSVAKTHTGSFTRGQTEATYTVLVSNTGGNATSGPVTVTESLPIGLSLGAMSGAGWDCEANSCTRSDALSAASSYPALTVTVDVAANAPAQVTNQVSVSGGGSAMASASDPTTIDTPGSGIAVMQSPPPGSVLAGSTVTFTWSAGAGVSAYRIDVGASPGSGEYFLGNPGPATSQVVSNLPTNGRTVYVTLSSLFGDVWQSDRYTYTASGGATGASSYLITTIVGGAAPATAVSGIAVTVPTPQGIATDAVGNVYFSSGTLNSVFKLSAGGVLTRVAGNRAAGSSGDGGAATSAALWGPSGVAVDAPGNLYIADRMNNRIRKVSASTGAITTVAGNGARGYFSGDGGIATSATLDGPEGVALDTAGNLYIADTGQSRIRKVTASNGLITTVAGNGQWGFSGDGGGATSATLNRPKNVAVDAAGNLYIADSGNHRIRKVTASNGMITTVAGIGTAGFSGDGGPATGARLYYPDGVALDTAGNLYIADSGNYFIRKVTAASGVITTVAGGGVGSYSGDGGVATRAALNWPEGVAVDTSGNLFIADSRNNRVRKVSAGGIISTVVGGGVGDGSLAVFAPMASISGVARDSSGAMYVSDSFEHRVRKIASNGVITTVAGIGTAGFSGDRGAATRAALTEPSGLAVDAAGNLYIADEYNNRIRKVTAATGVITTVAGNGSGGFSGDGGAATSAALWVPQSIALDAVGNLYVADRGNSRVRKITAATGVITTVAGNGTYGSSGDGGAATGATLGMPWGVAVDAAGNLYISDYGYSRIRKVTASNGVITTLAGNGTNGFSGDGAAAADAVLFYPSGVAVDAAGNLYFADEFNGRIRRVAASGTITTVAGNGKWSYSGDGGDATSAAFNAPWGVTVDSAGNIYVADKQNGAVRLLSPTGTAPALTVTSAHSGAFAAGQNGSYTLTVANAVSAGTTTGAVTVTELMPAGLTVVSMSGSGWSCSARSCTRSDSLTGGSSYPAITVLVNTSSTAPEQVTNQVSVSGGGAAITGAQDLTLITGLQQSSSIVVTPGTSDVFSIAGSQGQFTVGADRKVYTVRNSGSGAMAMQVRTPAWLTAIPATAGVGGGSSITVTVATNSQINSLAAGPYVGTIDFTDGSVTTSRNVVLLVREASTLTPALPAGCEYAAAPTDQLFRALNTLSSIATVHWGTVHLANGGYGSVPMGFEMRPGECDVYGLPSRGDYSISVSRSGGGSQNLVVTFDGSPGFVISGRRVYTLRIASGSCSATGDAGISFAAQSVYSVCP